MNSWDKFIIPKPFGTINYYISDLIDFMNEREDLIKEFLEFVIDKREKEIEERIREFEKIKEFVREL